MTDTEATTAPAMPANPGVTDLLANYLTADEVAVALRLRGGAATVYTMQRRTGYPRRVPAGRRDLYPRQWLEEDLLAGRFGGQQDEQVAS